MDKTYFKDAAREQGVSVHHYYADADKNFVIVEGNVPECWDDGCPEVFGSMDDALSELTNWPTIRNVSVITEREFLNTYCSSELKQALDEEETVMDVTNNHNAKLVAQINDLWAEDKSKFALILRALYKRDIEEISCSDGFGWSGESLSTMKRQLDDAWSYFARPYLMRVADDRDLDTIIKFIR